MVPYKRIDLIVESFSAVREKRFVEIDAGPEMEKVKAKADPNVALLDCQEADLFRDYPQKARAFVVAEEEDSEIAPLEAQACGYSVIADGRGDARETIVAFQDDRWKYDDAEVRGLADLFFEQQTVESVCEAVKRFERNRASVGSDACCENAVRSSTGRFQSQFLQFVEWAVANYGVEWSPGVPGGHPSCESY